MVNDEVMATLDDYARLFDLMDEIKQLAPWTYMLETDTFVMENPNVPGQMLLVSVMGNRGEYLTIASYVGDTAIARFFRIQKQQHMEVEDLAYTMQLHATFEDRNALTDRDRQIIKEVGRKYRGRQSWPQFRSYSPGFEPWYLTRAEAVLLTHVLAQTLNVARRFQTDPQLLKGLKLNHHLFRIPTVSAEGVVWQDVIRQYTPVERFSIDVRVSAELMANCATLPRRPNVVEIHFMLTPIRVGERGARARYVHLLIMVDAASGALLNMSPIESEDSLDDMFGRVAHQMLEAFSVVGWLPSEVRVPSDFVSALLTPPFSALGVSVVTTKDVPALADFIAQLNALGGLF